MAWAIPLILGVGATLLTVPVILHFLMRPKPKRVDLPTLRFLQQRQQTTRSRMRIRHLMLLLLRCLLIALAAIALAGPAVASRDFGNWLTLGGVGLGGLLVAALLAATWFGANRNMLLASILGVLLVGLLGFGGWSLSKVLGREGAVVLGDSQAPIAAIVAVDTSPRMSYRQNNETRLEQATETAIWLVRQFPEGSRVCVLATDHDEPFFSVDLAAAERRLEKLEVDFVPAGLPETLENAIALLEEAEQERKEIYVLSDLSSVSWAGQSSRSLGRRLERLSEASVMLVDVGQPEFENYSLAPLVLSAAEITGKDGLVVSSELRRFGSAGQRTVRFTVEQPDATRPVMRDGQAIYSDVAWEQTATIDVREDGSTPIEFRFRQELKPGTYHGRVELVGSDSLDHDNRREFTFLVSPQWKTLVVAPDGVSTKNLTSTIAPRRSVETGSSLYDCVTSTVQDFETLTDYSEYEAVFLLDPMPLTEAAWQRLSDFAAAGGGVAIFAGHNAARGPEADASFGSPSALAATGVRLTQPWRSADADLFLSPAEHEMAHPLFRSFRRVEAGIPWNRFPVALHWGSEAAQTEPNESMQRKSETASVLLRFSNREPAVWEHRVGSGRVVTMTTPISEPAWSEDRTVWNELFLGKPLPAWLLTRAIAHYVVANDSESLNLPVGQAAAFENDLRSWPESYRVFTPATDQPPAKVNAIDGTVRYRFNNLPGHYRLKGQLDGPVLRGFSSYLDAAATDLTRLEAGQLDEILGAQRYQIVLEKDEIVREQGTSRSGQEFYPLLMLTLLIAMSVEQLVANQFYRR